MAGLPAAGKNARVSPTGDLSSASRPQLSPRPGRVWTPPGSVWSAAPTPRRDEEPDDADAVTQADILMATRGVAGI